HLAHVVLDALKALLDHRLAGDLVGDDLGPRVRGGVDLVAVPVVPVEIGVDLVGGGGDRDVDAVGHPAEVEAGVATGPFVTATVHGARSSPGDTMRTREAAQAIGGRPP